METNEATSPLSLEQREELREHAKEDLYFFAKGVCGFDWLTPAIHLPLCRLLEDYQTNTKMDITLPRGWLKTTLVSQAYSIWRAIRDPNVRILLAQNTFTNSVSKLSVIKSMFEKNVLIRELFPDLLPDSSCIWKSESLCLRRPKSMSESTFEAAGIRTQVVSRHYDVIIEDDTVAPDLDDLGESNLCPSKDDIAQAIGWHRLVPPLLINPAKSQNIVVGTRWFEKDLLSWIRDHEKSFLHYTRACLEKDGVPDENGEITYLERFPQKVLDSLKDSMGPYMFSCLYLNKPLRSDDMIFQQEWFRYYETAPASLMTYTTVDPGGDPEDTKGEPDYNVVITTGKDLYTGRIYVLEYSRRKCSPGELITMIFDHVRRWKPVKVGIETVAYQKSLCYWIRERQKADSLYFLIEQITQNRRSKNARIMGLQPLVASGNMLFRAHMSALISELMAFPLGANDDLADALAMQIGMWAITSSVEEEKKRQFASDPFSVDAAIDELRGRHKKPYQGVLDTLKSDKLALQF